ncbi:MAG: FG-GAP repeat domain-containing protein, partial [Planctomycetaceae bacterium]
MILLAFAGECGSDKKAEPKLVGTPKQQGRKAARNSSKATPKPKAGSTGNGSSQSRQPEATSFELVDVARKQGIDFQYNPDVVPDRFFMPESIGGATMAWLDFDLDGTQDLYLIDGNRIESPSLDYRNRLYRNEGSKFSLLEESGAEDIGYGVGVAVGDFDLDGFPDIYVSNYGPNALLHNNGDGTFSPTGSSTVVEDEGWGAGCVWFDANNDRLPDLYVANYVDISLEDSQPCRSGDIVHYCGPTQFLARPDRVFLNLGDGSFREATEELGFKTEPGYSLGVMVADLNQDARPELVVARDLSPNCLFVQDENGSWSDRASPAGVAFGGNGKKEAGMGVACADFDGDLQFDFVLTHYHEQKNTLYRNLGDLVFADDSFRSGIAATSLEFLGFGINVIDINRDAAPDLFVTNGHVFGPNHDPNEMTGQILLNNGSGRFKDVSNRCGPYFDRQVLGRGSAVADFDNDGDLDIGVGHLDARFSLLEDRMHTEKWVGLDIVSADRVSVAGGSVLVESGELERRIPLLTG